MRLGALHVVGLGPLEDLTFRFADEDGKTPGVGVVLGGSGVGKTSLLTAIASTRPGHAVAFPRRGDDAPFAVADWIAGDDDPARPHPLRVASPGAVLEDDEVGAAMRRREQAVFDRRAAEGGFVLCSFSGARWFSKSPLVLSAPERSVARYDVRTPAALDDPTRADLARPTKQVLSYASIAAALSGRDAPGTPHAARAAALERALAGAVTRLTTLADCKYVGTDPATLEPIFERAGGAQVRFDDLPTGARHLASFAALPLRMLHAAYPDRDPLDAEGVVLIDDVDVHLDPTAHEPLAAALREALPRVQWIVTTASRAVAGGCDPPHVMVLRQMPVTAKIELFAGDQAVIH